MSMNKLKKSFKYTHYLEHYDFDDLEFDEAVAFLRAEEAKAVERVMKMGATDDIQVRMSLEAAWSYGDPEVEFAMVATGTRLETDEEERIRHRKNRKVAETRELQAQQKKEAEHKLYLKLKKKYEEDANGN